MHVSFLTIFDTGKYIITKLLVIIYTNLIFIYYLIFTIYIYIIIKILRVCFYIIFFYAISQMPF